MPRMKILSGAEQDSFDNPPTFNSAERKRFFEFSSELLDAAQRLRMPEHRIGFLLSCGYFRAVKKFFMPHEYHQCDVEYVARCLKESPECFIANCIPEASRRRHRQRILAYYGYRQFDQNGESCIRQEIAQMVSSQLKPKLIFWRCIDVLNKNRIQTPNYDQLSRIILSGLNQRKKDLAIVIDKELTTDARTLLDGLFEQKGETAYARYKLTLLKKLSQSTKPMKIKERTNNLTYIADLYNNLAPVLCVLNLGHEGIRYFANSVIKADIFQLNQRGDEDRYVHVTAFIAHQYYRLQDNLVDTLLTSIRTFQNGAKRDHKDWCYDQHKEQAGSIKALIASLDKNIFGVLQKILDITKDSEADDTGKLARICHLLDAQNDNIPQAEQQWQVLAQDLENEAGYGRYYDILEERSIRLQNRVGSIIKALNFGVESGNAEIFEAITYFKDKDGAIGKNAPLGFLGIC